jgi:hypothetical protein
VTCPAGQDTTALDILSIRVIPKDHLYGDPGVAAVDVAVGYQVRRALYLHPPGRLEYEVRLPEDGRLDVGLGVLHEDIPVTFRFEVRPRGEGPATVFTESYGDRDSWAQRSVDLSRYAGQRVTLALSADSEETGQVAFWGAPTVSGVSRRTEKPNVIFYVIDGAGAEYMSLYGYNRRTTPNLERLAAEGAVFERAYSNSSWTRPSNASFMTSLHHSVLGGFRGGFNTIPEDVPTMAQRLRRAGYQAAVLTPNPNAADQSDLHREVDFFRQRWPEIEDDSESSRHLQKAFWDWRGDYPGEPYWVHFQTVDVHEDFPTVAPFSSSRAETQIISSIAL